VLEPERPVFSSQLAVVLSSSFPVGLRGSPRIAVPSRKAGGFVKLIRKSGSGHSTQPFAVPQPRTVWR
jgi:hypothetical protein